MSNIRIDNAAIIFRLSSSSMFIVRHGSFFSHCGLLLEAINAACVNRKIVYQ